MKRSKLGRVSKNRAVELRRYAKLRDKFLQDQPWCEIGTSSCTSKPIEVHHANRRYGKNLNDPEHWFAVCRNCHDWIESHKREARKRGYILYK